MSPQSSGPKNKREAKLCLPPALRLSYSFTLTIEATCSSETCRYIPEDRTLHNQRSENLNSYK
jgi:hypothetical protein